MNYMPKVLDMLGVAVGELFNIKGFAMNPYQFDEEYNLIVDEEYKLIGMEFYVRNEFIRGLIIGKYEIEKLPWKPKEGEYYHAILHNGSIDFCRWGSKWYDYYCYNSGNCFKTKREITPEIKQRILSEMKGKYENDI